MRSLWLALTGLVHHPRLWLAKQQWERDKMASDAQYAAAKAAVVADMNGDIAGYPVAKMFIAGLPSNALDSFAAQVSKSAVDAVIPQTANAKGPVSPLPKGGTA